MITLQRRIFSLTAASPSGGAVIFCFAACISAIPYLHISIIHILPRHPFRRPIFSYIISPAASRPSYISILLYPPRALGRPIFPYYYLPHRLSTVIYISVLLSSPPPLGRHIFPYYYIPRTLSAVPYFRIIIFPAASRPSHISILLYPLPPLPPPIIPV